ncbi:MAG: hypothetical protein JWO32_1855 [Bacteroidetes bacterium]|nr:hypothetical protein [Bacteroidota bacterium]
MFAADVQRYKYYYTSKSVSGFTKSHFDIFLRYRHYCILKNYIIKNPGEYPGFNFLISVRHHHVLLLQEERSAEQSLLICRAYCSHTTNGVLRAMRQASFRVY